MTQGRRRARKEALFILYQADLLGLEPAAALERAGSPDTPGEADIGAYTRRLVEGVAAHGEAIDGMIARNLVGWTIDRLAPLERNVLRLGVLESVFVEDVPDAVAIDEAVELAKTFCSEEAAALVNGVLGGVQRERGRSRGSGTGEYTRPQS